MTDKRKIDPVEVALREIELALTVWPGTVPTTLRGWSEWSFYALTGEWS